MKRKISTMFCAVLVLSFLVLHTTPQAESFQEKDTNKDGKISSEEFGNSITFRQADLDEDDFISEEEYALLQQEEQNTQLKLKLLEYGACLRSYLLRYDHYPESFDEIVEEKLIAVIEPDPWGFELQYRVFEQSSDEDSLENLEKPAEQSSSENSSESVLKRVFEVLSVGPDGVAGSSDDILLTPQGIRLTLSPQQHQKILREDQENYIKARNAWNWEQAFRLWLEIAEAEYAEDKKITEINQLELPEELFPEGKALDTFERQFELKSIRGLRVVTALTPDKSLGNNTLNSSQEKVSLTESDFIQLLSRRLESRNDYYDWNASNFVEQVIHFYNSNGRLPLTKLEVTKSGTHYYGRSDNLYYLPLANDTRFMLFSYTHHNVRDRYQCYYAPVDTLSLLEKNEFSWNNVEIASSEVFQGIIEAIKAKKVRDSLDSATENSDGARASSEARTPEALSPDEIIIPEPPKEEEEQEALAPDQEENATEEEETEEEAQETKAPEEASRPQDNDEALIAFFSKSTHLHRPTLIQEEEETEASEKQGFKSQRELVPTKLYTEVEAQQMGVLGSDNELWEIESGLGYQAEQLYYATYDFLLKVEPTVSLPCGNIELSNAELFREHSEDYLEERSWVDLQPQALAITRYKRDENNMLESVVCIAIPEEESGAPIVVYAFIQGEFLGPLYARLQDQPEGWLENIIACDGAPENSLSDTEDKTTTPDENPSDQPSENSTPEQKKPEEE